MKNKKILITGGAGFIGSHLSETLSKNNKVVVLDKLLRGNKLLNNNKIKFIYGDVRDYSLVEKVSKGCDVIFHLAALLGVEMVSRNNILTMDTEFIGMKNVCRAALKNNIKKIAYTSSSGVYGKLNFEKNVSEDTLVVPASAYALSKKFNEIYLENMNKQYGLKSVSFRLFNVYGPRQDNRMVIPRFYNQCISGKDITVYQDGKQTRDFTYIDDCIYSMIEATKKIKNYEILNISRGADMRIIEIAKLLKTMTGSKSKIKFITVPKNLEEFQVKKRCGNSKKLKNLINYKPTTSILDGLKKTYFYK
jgi:UDP-glucose 4-epimerase